MQARLYQKGFTLAEVLIALALLGIVAAFAIPKVLQSQGDARRKALVKETYAAFSEAVYEGVQTGKLNIATGFAQRRQYYKDKFNAVKMCNNSQVEDCWSHNFDRDSGNPSCPTLPEVRTLPGMILPNGVTVAGFDEGDDNGHHWMAFDYNGKDGPNKHGEDQFFFLVAYEKVEGLTAGKVYIGGIGGTPRGVCSLKTQDAFTALMN